ncbi:WD40-repeat-containing domain [Pseudocohnilembus persalinus]|uniref:Probable cytosolic iron-sulfur protein assembly protein CIAO1 homolog n=1 Tax=Pseudocohnilembus persalinus TaxID=266149 RepID=A0A0V0R881_PSEPJ|nr:WD40-repeat-containing domain [Pseudocohnilembus persalinus]|eukprot:KRX10692.1 WD40-repeat-containing domain [Pseudocohnilembus persalinus]
MKLIQEIQGGQERLWTCTWHPQGKIFATAGSDKVIKIWGQIQNEKKISDENMEQDNNLEIPKYEILQMIDGIHDKSIRCLSFSPNGQLLASGSFDSQIGIYKLNQQSQKFEFVQKLEGHEYEIKYVGWSYDSQFLISCSRDKTIWIWDYDEDLDFSCYAVLDGHTQDVKCAKFAPNSFNVLSSSFDDTIRFWEQDDEDWITKGILQEHGSIVWQFDFCNQGNIMASVSEDNSIKIWKKNENENSKQVYLLDQDFKDVHKRPVYTCSFSQDGVFLVSGGGDNQISLFQKDFENEQQYQLKCQIQEAHVLDINCMQFSPNDQDILISVGDDRKIKIWKVQADL